METQHVQSVEQKIRFCIVRILIHLKNRPIYANGNIINPSSWIRKRICLFCKEAVKLQLKLSDTLPAPSRVNDWKLGSQLSLSDCYFHLLCVTVRLLVFYDLHTCIKGRTQLMNTSLTANHRDIYASLLWLTMNHRYLKPCEPKSSLLITSP